MKKINELKKDQLFHVASLINHNYINNYRTFETVTGEDNTTILANNCMCILLVHVKGDLTSVSHKSSSGWINTPADNYYEVINYLNDLEYADEGYSPSTKISIDDSIKMLKVALEDVLVDVTISYKKQLNEDYGKE